ncbi:hypothetical protein HAX54_033161, partial [Datura stramonium]|nr:hypothetical protein [Datura stramonium]
MNSKIETTSPTKEGKRSLNVHSLQQLHFFLNLTNPYFTKYKNVVPLPMESVENPTLELDIDPTKWLLPSGLLLLYRVHQELVQDPPFLDFILIHSTPNQSLSLLTSTVSLS